MKLLNSFIFLSVMALSYSASADTACTFQQNGQPSVSGNNVNINFSCNVNGAAVAIRSLTISPPYTQTPSCSLTMLDSGYVNNGSCLAPNVVVDSGCNNVGAHAISFCANAYNSEEATAAVIATCGAGCPAMGQPIGSCGSQSNPLIQLTCR